MLLRLLSSTPLMRLCHAPAWRFCTFPQHQLLSMPALSPTMTQGKVIKWYKAEGQAIEAGDAICEIQTDKATVAFQVQEKGIVAKILNSQESLNVGVPIAVVTRKKEDVAKFKTFAGLGNAAPSSKSAASTSSTPPPQASSPPPQNPSSSLPAHDILKMPALSPTMSEGKIVKWAIKQGDSFNVGDALCSVETDKAVVDFQASEKGYLAKIIAQTDVTLKVGSILGVSTRKKDDVSSFKDFRESSSAAPASGPAATSSVTQPQTPLSNTNSTTPPPGSHPRYAVSPLARAFARQKGMDLQKLSIQGSGPNGRIIKQDVELAASNMQKQETAPTAPKLLATETTQTEKPKTSTKVTIPENPYIEIPLNNMRKIIAARLTESKTTIPHYYVNVGVQMDAVNRIRNTLNEGEKDNGVKISVNDIIVKAVALALRDYPAVNSQWHGTHIKRFQHADVSVAVATDGGLITPIVFRAEQLGLIDIAKRTKDVAKRAREGKLDPKQYIGGTTTVSNLGMFGIDSVTSVINPPQSTILGVGRTDKKLLFDGSADPSKPYRVAEVMELIVSADHRAVDGALAAQWLTRIKKYLEHPHQMLL